MTWISLTSVLKRAGIWLELLTNPDMLLMFDRATRGGITQAVHRYAEANNKYMRDKFNLERAASYSILMQTIYGWAMSHPLPTGGVNLLATWTLIL